MSRSITRIRCTISTGIRHLLLILWCSISLFPILWIVANSFKDNKQIYSKPFHLPDPVIMKNFPHAFMGIHLSTTLLNSLIYSVMAVSITLLLASMASFYISKIQKKSFLYLYFILGIMIPVQVILIPIFVILRDMGLVNSRFGIILVYIVSNLSISVFIISGFMRKGVPDELLEAGIIDGCGPLGVFFYIALPISKPGIATVGTFVFLGIWNEFLFALLMLANPKLRTLNLSVFMLRGHYSSDQGLMAAGIVILIVPAILIFIVFQEQVVKGLTSGAIKG